MTDDESPQDPLAGVIRREFWSGQRKMFTLLFAIGAALLAVDFLVLDFGKSDDASALAVVLFRISMGMAVVGMLGHQVMDIRDRRREKRLR